MKITGVLLIGMMVCLQGCGVSEDSHATLTAQLTPIQISSITPTSEPTLEPLLMYFLQTKTEFDRSDAILFSVSPGFADTSDISITNADGSDVECITCDVSESLIRGGYYSAPKFYSPRWSPDGTMYVFGFESMEEDSILIRGKNMSEIELVKSESVWYTDIAWSPNGKYIAFSTGPTRGGPTRTSSVCYIEVDLSRPGQVTEKCVAPVNENRGPAWSPDGKRIIFSGGDSLLLSGKPTDLYIWDLENQSVTQLIDTPESEIVPKWSPEGSRLAFVARDNETYNYSLWIANADGTGATRIGGEEDIFDFDWSPDGTQIVFTQISPILNQPCDFGCLPFTVLKIIDLETGAITSLTDGTQWIGDPAWKP